MAKCSKCKRDINNGTERQKMVTIYRQPDGSEGVSSPYEGLHAKGQLLRCYHFKCYKVEAKIERRTADEKSMIGDRMPTAYEIEALTMNADEARDAGMTAEEAATHNTREFSERAQAQFRKSVDKVDTDKDRDPNDWRDQEVYDIEDLPAPEEVL